MTPRALNTTTLESRLHQFGHYFYFSFKLYIIALATALGLYYNFVFQLYKAKHVPTFLITNRASQRQSLYLDTFGPQACILCSHIHIGWFLFLFKDHWLLCQKVQAFIIFFNFLDVLSFVDNVRNTSFPLGCVYMKDLMGKRKV